ncbi:hypothetical protein OYT40_002174 [Escherichia coli]|nr:hypothetical protein [Escherichia coli]
MTKFDDAVEAFQQSLKGCSPADVRSEFNSLRKYKSAVESDQKAMQELVQLREFAAAAKMTMLQNRMTPRLQAFFSEEAGKVGIAYEDMLSKLFMSETPKTADFMMQYFEQWDVTMSALEQERMQLESAPATCSSEAVQYALDEVAKMTLSDELSAKWKAQDEAEGVTPKATDARTDALLAAMKELPREVECM